MVLNICAQNVHNMKCREKEDEEEEPGLDAGPWVRAGGFVSWDVWLWSLDL